MRRPIAAIVDDITRAIALCREAIAESTLEQFRTSRVAVAAVERGLEVISEAVRHIPQHLLATQAEVPWAAVKAIGNKLRHEYHRTDEKILWDIVVYEFGSLETAINAIARALNGEDSSRREP